MNHINAKIPTTTLITGQVVPKSYYVAWSRLNRFAAWLPVAMSDSRKGAENFCRSLGIGEYMVTAADAHPEEPQTEDAKEKKRVKERRRWKTKYLNRKQRRNELVEQRN